MNGLDYFHSIMLLMMHMNQKISTNDKADFTFPGTYWCGPGSTAVSSNQLGYFTATDKCCRQHDSCDEFILAGTTKHGLINKDPYTRMRCDCDMQFRKCLHAVRSFPLDKLVAELVGEVFFSLLTDRCFEKINCTDALDQTSSHNVQPVPYVWKTMPPF